MPRDLHIEKLDTRAGSGAGSVQTTSTVVPCVVGLDLSQYASLVNCSFTACNTFEQTDTLLQFVVGVNIN
jgi:hypothetical protein